MTEIRYLVRTNCEYSIEVDAASEKDALRKTEAIDFNEWAQAWSPLEAEIVSHHVHVYTMSRYCGAMVCDEEVAPLEACGDHRGLERCFCGWSRTSPGRGMQEMVEMGEVIDDD